MKTSMKSSKMLSAIINSSSDGMRFAIRALRMTIPRRKARPCPRTPLQSTLTALTTA
jgi:hypothetical protein